MIAWHESGGLYWATYEGLSALGSDNPPILGQQWSRLPGQGLVDLREPLRLWLRCMTAQSNIFDLQRRLKIGKVYGVKRVEYTSKLDGRSNR